MAITQVGTATSGSDTVGNNFSVTKPTGVASGDVLIIFGASNKGAWDTLPSGFVQFAVSTDGDVTNQFRAYGWYKVCGGSEPASYTFGSTTASASGAPIVAVMTAYRGVDNVNPIDVVSVVSENASATEPANPTISATQTTLGLPFFARAARKGGTGGVPTVPTFTEAVANWTEVVDHGSTSGTGSTNYAIGYFDHDTEVGSGSRTEPATTCSTTEDTNVYILGVLRTAPSGTFAHTLPKVTASFAGERQIPAGPVGATIPAVTSQFEGIGAPPDGPMEVTLAPVTAAVEATSVGGGFESTTPAISAAVEGSVNPIGGFECTLAPVTATIQAETRSFGEHVITVEADHRAFRVVDAEDGSELIPIKRSEVTDL